MAAALLMPTSVDSGTYVTNVVNLDLQQRQMLAAIGSACLFIGGVVLIAASAIIEALSATPRLTAPLPALAASDLPPTVSADVGDETTLTMQQYGITKEVNGYRYGPFVYATLDQATRQAERGGR